MALGAVIGSALGKLLGFLKKALPMALGYLTGKKSQEAAQAKEDRKTLKAYEDISSGPDKKPEGIIQKMKKGKM